jgi:hypothetical protein
MARIDLSKRPSVEIAAEREPWQIDRARGLGGDDSAKLVNASLQGSKLDPQRANLALHLRVMPVDGVTQRDGPVAQPVP